MNNGNNNPNNNSGPIFNVVLNDEEQYSIWPANRAIPNGWHHEGTSGSKEVCLEHIENVWVDMRPLSVRRQLAVAGNGGS